MRSVNLHGVTVNGYSVPQETESQLGDLSRGEPSGASTATDVSFVSVNQGIHH